jgi:hypothetical protein
MPSSGSLEIKEIPMLGLYYFKRRDYPKMIWHRRAETCSRLLIFTINCILLSTFLVGQNQVSSKLHSNAENAVRCVVLLQQEGCTYFERDNIQHGSSATY